nr:IclR family transcriptional regulator [Chelatococcus sp. YT9]
MEGSLDRRVAERQGGFQSIAAVDHALAVLKTLATSAEPLGVNELARRIGLHKSTVSRLLRTLENHHFIQRDATHGRISLGLGVVALAGPMLGAMDVIAIGRPVLERIANTTGETVSLALWNGQEAVMVEQVLGTRTVVHYTWRGKAVPAHSTAVGKIFLAFLPDSEVRPILAAPLERFTEYTIVDPERMAAEIARIRHSGYALNFEENELESCGVAAAAYDFNGKVATVLNIAIPKYRFDEEQQMRLAKIVVEGARELSGKLGHGNRAP